MKKRERSESGWSKRVRKTEREEDREMTERES